MKTTRTLAVLAFTVLPLLPPSVIAADAPVVDLNAARATDPIAMGWMQGSPVPADKQLRYQDRSFYQFPQWRWTFSHWRQFVPTIEVERGDGPVHQLTKALRSDLDAVTFTPIGGTKPMSWQDSLVANYTDGIVVLHRGAIVYEGYFGALQDGEPHIAFSVTKSFFGTLAGMLIDEGKLDANAPASRYVPELAGSGFGDARVQQVLDMTTALDFTETYDDSSPTMQRYRFASGYGPTPPDYTGPLSLQSLLPTIPKQGTHGTEFHYRTPNVDVMNWIMTRVTGKSADVLLSERLWSRIGTEADAYMQVDVDGTPVTGFALNGQLRDLARFGELMRNGGKFNGEQIVPAAVVRDIEGGASKEAFLFGNYATLPGWSYHNFWWVSHDDHGVYMARGIHGQAIYVDPKAEMVIARFASHPVAGNVGIDPLSLPAYRAIAEYLMANPR